MVKGFEKLIVNISAGFINIRAEEIDKCLNKALREIGEFLGVEHSTLFLFRKDCLTADRAYEWCAEGSKPQLNLFQKVNIGNFPWIMEKFYNNETVYIPGKAKVLKDENREKKFLELHQIQTIILIPIISNGSLLGFMSFNNFRKEKKWGREEIMLLRKASEIFINVLERKRLEDEWRTLEAWKYQEAIRALRSSEEKLQRITENMLDMIGQTDLNGIYQYISPSFKSVLGYEPEKMLGKLSAEFIHPEDLGKVTAVMETTLKTRFPGKVEFRHRHARGGYLWLEAICNLIVDKDNRITGTVYGARDITERKMNEECLRQSYDKLKKSIEMLTKAMEMIVEIRDPYTAGHQRRVAVLASAIGREMGLSEDKVAGIHLAASIHDIGKIYVPAEILSKPGRINTHEFEIIKSHPKVGFDILKNVEFPWPIAGIVVQHHERINGSGYPAGLQGNKILIEAKIIAVADVVEAMASHRPYRPALGIEEALHEISQNRGTLYDSGVVEACLQVFRKNFSFD